MHRAQLMNTTSWISKEKLADQLDQLFGLRCLGGDNEFEAQPLLASRQNNREITINSELDVTANARD